MKPTETTLLSWLLVILCSFGALGSADLEPPAQPELPGFPANRPAPYASPSALAVTRDGKRIFIACANAGLVVVYDTAASRVTTRISVPDSPSGVALSKDNSRLYVTCAAPISTLCVVDLERTEVIDRIPLGHTAVAPVLSPDGRKLYVCIRFENTVATVDLAAGREVQRVRVEREPVAAALTPDGKTLVVANHLHAGSANDLHATAMVSFIDTERGVVTSRVRLPLGSSLLRGVAISPDGRFAAVTHLRSLFWLTTSAVNLGRINCNAVSFLDLKTNRTFGTLLLDQAARGAANPWGVVWTEDGKTIAVSQAGAHELSLIDAPVETDPWNFFSLELGYYGRLAEKAAAAPAHPVRVRQRIVLPGEGPRALAVAGSQLFVANYFSDNLCRIDLDSRLPAVKSLSFWAETEPGIIRRGEMLFNDARLCSQQWQSCASCHDVDARTDALNWDLLNDGTDNPKNTKSLVWAHQTAPAMALGVRSSAQAAVRAGIHHILFTEQPPDVPEAIDAYLQSLRPLPSPRLVNGALSEAARRGEKLFNSPRTRCADCHPPPLYTDLSLHDVGTATAYRGMLGRNGADDPRQQFDTPALAELWRTGPYLHDGSATNLREVLTKNARDAHGRTSTLTGPEIADLIEFLSSL